MNSIYYQGNFIHVYPSLDGNVWRFITTHTSGVPETFECNLSQQDIEYLANQQTYKDEWFNCLDGFGKPNGDKLRSAEFDGHLFLSFFTQDMKLKSTQATSFRMFAELVESLI